MKTLVAVLSAFGLWLGASNHAWAAEQKIRIVAAENFYGDVAGQIGGNAVMVANVMSNPDQDPHLFEVSPSAVRQIAKAQIVIYNGADYDTWMQKLLGAASVPDRAIIVAAKLVNKKAGDNPHLWYDPATMPAVATAVADALSAADPAGKSGFAARLAQFRQSLQPLDEAIARIRTRYAGTPVAATEPVFNYMATALKLDMRELSFQLAIMNGTEPGAGDVARFEHDLSVHAVRVVFHNNQTSNKAVERLIRQARSARVPVVGVSETLPSGESYQDWMLRELEATEKALAGSLQ